MYKCLILLLVLGLEAYQDPEEKILYCYYHSDFSGGSVGVMARLRPRSIDPYLCTHIGYMSFKAVGKGEEVMIVEDDPKKRGLYHKGDILEEVLDLKRVNSNLKIIAVFPNWVRDSLQMPVMAATDAMRKKFVSAALSFVRDNHLDGIDINWNFPNMQNLFPDERQDYVELLKEVWTQFHPKGLLVTAYITSKPVSVNNSYILDEISKYVHFLNVAAFHYNGIYGRQTGMNSPMFSKDYLNIHFTFDNLLFRGVPANKILIGLPTFGHQFLMNRRVRGNDFLNVQSDETFPSEYTGSKNIIGYNEICHYFNVRGSNWKEYWDPVSLTPYMVDGKRFISFDNPISLQEKVKFAIHKEFKGVMIWNLCLDDFRGDCKGETFPLTRSIHKLMSFGEFKYDVQIVNEYL